MVAIFIRLSVLATGNNRVEFCLFFAISRLLVSALILVPTWKKIKQVLGIDIDC